MNINFSSFFVLRMTMYLNRILLYFFFIVNILMNFFHFLYIFFSFYSFGTTAVCGATWWTFIMSCTAGGGHFVCRSPSWRPSAPASAAWGWGLASACPRLLHSLSLIKRLLLLIMMYTKKMEKNYTDFYFNWI